jgi:hypothetical protein
MPSASGSGGGTGWEVEDSQKWLSHISPPPLWGSGIYFRVGTQHLRAGLNSSAALRAFDAQCFGQWRWHGMGGGTGWEAARDGRRRTTRNGCPAGTILMLGLALVRGARLRSGRLGRRPWRRVCRPLLPSVDAGSGRCGDRLRDFAGSCRCGFFRNDRRI